MNKKEEKHVTEVWFKNPDRAKAVRKTAKEVARRLDSKAPGELLTPRQVAHSILTANNARLEEMNNNQAASIHELTATLEQVVRKATGRNSFEDAQQEALNYLTATAAPRAGDQIIYKDMVYDADGAYCRKASFTKDDIFKPVSVVLNYEAARFRALAKLDGVDKLVLGL